MTSPYLLLVLNMLFWAGNWIVGRALRDDITPLGLNFWRWSIALALLLPFSGRELWTKRDVIVRDWKILLGLGLLSISLFNLMIYLALQDTTSINGVLISASQPVAIVLASWLLVRETVTLRQALGILISLLGVTVIVMRGDLAMALAIRFNRGDLWVLASMPVWALYSVLLRARPPELSGTALLAGMMLFGVGLLLPFYLYSEAAGTPVRFDPPTVAAMLYLGLFSSLFGLVFYNRGVAALGPNVAGLFLHLVPVFTIFLAWGFLGEAPQLFHLPGIVLIFSGIYLTTVRRRRAFR